MQNNGQTVQTGWGTAGEGYLVYDPNDANNSTQITQDSQLIAGFGALQTLAQQVDGTGSGTLDASNALWGDLKVWVDTTGTGQFQSGQLMSLAQLGITSINLDASQEDADSNGNTIVADSTFTWRNGQQGDMVGVDLRFLPGSTANKASNTATGVDALIQAMASFAPPAAAQISGASQQPGTVLTPLLATSWH